MLFIVIHIENGMVYRYLLRKKLCDALRDLVLVVHFKKYEKNPRRSAIFSCVAGQKLSKTLPVSVFHVF